MVRFAIILLAVSVEALSFSVASGQATQSEADVLPQLLRHAQPLAPPGSGPFPVVALVPGCSGFEDGRFVEQYRAYSERLVAAGFAVVRVDYLKARSVVEACADRAAGTWEPRIAGDIGQLIERLPDILRADRSRVFVIGWSMGGGGVLTTLSKLSQANPFPFRGVVALYPSCRAVPAWSSRVPTLIMLAGLDNIQPASACEQLVRSIGSPPSVRMRRFERAHHGFDIMKEPVLREPRAAPTLGANPEAAAAAWRDIFKFLGA